MPDFLTMGTYLTEYPGAGWLVAAALFFVLEAAAFPGVGLFFAGCGALTLGGLLTFGVLADIPFTTQLAWFFGCTSVWTAVLWVPLKKLYSKAEFYDALIGTTAIAGKDGLRKGKTGQVRWSGTDMRARLSPQSQEDSVRAGEELFVHGREGMVLIVDTAPSGQQAPR